VSTTSVHKIRESFANKRNPRNYRQPDSRWDGLGASSEISSRT